MQSSVWRVKFIVDFGDEATETEVEVARAHVSGAWLA